MSFIYLPSQFFILCEADFKKNVKFRSQVLGTEGRNGGYEVSPPKLMYDNARKFRGELIGVMRAFTNQCFNSLIRG